MINLAKKIILFSVVLSSVVTSNLTLAVDSAEVNLSREELESRIRSQSLELEKLNRELAETQEKLQDTKTEKVGLQKELTTIKNNISQLNLSIRADKVATEKLSLEIDSLKYDIQDIELSVDDKRDAIVQLLRRLQRNSHTNLLIVLLKGNSLAENLLEAQSLTDTSSQLGIEIGGLDELRGAKVRKVGDIDAKLVEISERKRNSENKRIIIEDQEDTKETLLANTKNKESIYNQQLKELEKKQEEIAAEIEKVETELRKQIDPNLLPTPRPGVFLWPVKTVKITQRYGVTEFAKKNYRGQHHNGLDLGGPIGTPILAAGDGIVINVADQDQYRGCRGGAYGKLIVVKHKNGLTTLYAHLSRFIVSIGQEVKEGEVIGYMGKSGWATGPHLHFTVFANNTLTPARAGFPEGTKASRVCGPMPVGGDLDPEQYL
ncbi:MAG: peptidase M23 [Parcubacteria group bacterium Gr01-1014_20]|nr:MAG: peptidase M23 [Parcubacteria group bacterium Gr01-1014_20]